MVLKGLDKNGYSKIAYETALNHLENITKVVKGTGTVWENYAPESITEGDFAKSDFVGWMGLVLIAVFMEYVIGIQTKPETNRMVWHVNLTERHGIKQYPLSNGKSAGLIQEYDIKTAADIQEALKDLLGGTIQEMMEAEIDEHLGYAEYERSDNSDYRNGVKYKSLRSSYGEIPIDVPQDRDGDFEPQIVPKRKKDISEIEQKIIAMSAKGMTTRQISDIVEDIYGFEVSESMVIWRV